MQARAANWNWGCRRSVTHLALDMTDLRQIACHYDPGDLTVSVDAGMPLKELAAETLENAEISSCRWLCRMLRYVHCRRC